MYSVCHIPLGLTCVIGSALKNPSSINVTDKVMCVFMPKRPGVESDMKCVALWEGVGNNLIMNPRILLTEL